MCKVYQLIFLKCTVPDGLEIDLNYCCNKGGGKEARVPDIEGEISRDFIPGGR